MKRSACERTALTSGERARHQEFSRRLSAAVQERSELHDGHAFRLPSAELMTAAAWVTLERRCCPFLAFQIEHAEDQGERPQTQGEGR